MILQCIIICVHYRTDLKILLLVFKQDHKTEISFSFPELILYQATELSPSTHLPGVIGLQLDGGQCGQTGRKAHPLALDHSNAVEYDAVGQNQSHEGPAHCDQDCQTTVYTKDQGSVLWGQRGQRQCDRIFILILHDSMQHTRVMLVKQKQWINIRMKRMNCGESTDLLFMYWWFEWNTYDKHVKQFTSLLMLPYIHLYQSSLQAWNKTENMFKTFWTVLNVSVYSQEVIIGTLYRQRYSLTEYNSRSCIKSIMCQTLRYKYTLDKLFFSKKRIESNWIELNESTCTAQGLIVHISTLQLCICIHRTKIMYSLDWSAVFAHSQVLTRTHKHTNTLSIQIKHIYKYT